MDAGVAQGDELLANLVDRADESRLGDQRVDVRARVVPEGGERGHLLVEVVAVDAHHDPRHEREGDRLAPASAHAASTRSLRRLISSSDANGVLYSSA